MPPRIAFSEPLAKRDFLSSAFSLLTIFWFVAVVYRVALRVSARSDSALLVLNTAYAHLQLRPSFAGQPNSFQILRRCPFSGRPMEDL
jgi:hypothetical protein